MQKEENGSITKAAAAVTEVAASEITAEEIAAAEVIFTEITATETETEVPAAANAAESAAAEATVAAAARAKLDGQDSSAPGNLVLTDNSVASSPDCNMQAIPVSGKTKAGPKTFIYHNETLLLPKYDLIFKAIFGSERSKSVLAAFLSDVLDLPPIAPEELTIMNNELIPLNHQNKDCRLDVRVRINETAHVNIEIQLSNEYNILDRSVYYTADVLSRQLPPAADYSEVPPAIGLYILDYKQFDDNRLFRFSSMFDEETAEPVSQKLRIAYLELPKLKSLDLAKADEPRIQWARFIAADNQEVLDKLTYENEKIEEAVAILREASADPKLLYDYEMRIKGENDRIAALATAKKRGERQKQLEIARSMLETGMDVVIISKCTGLTEQEIQEIAAQQEQ